MKKALVPVEFAGWLGKYLIVRGLTADTHSVAAKVAPLTLQLEQAEIVYKKHESAVRHPDKMLTEAEVATLGPALVMAKRRMETIKTDIANAKKMVLKKTDRRGNAEYVYQALLMHELVRRVEVEGEWLKVFTKNLKLFYRDWREGDAHEPSGANEHVELGRMVVAFNMNRKFTSTNDQLRVYNLDYYCEDNPHPTVSASNHPCTGSWEDDLKSADKSGMLIQMVTGVLFMLTHPGDGDEGWIHYPTWQEEKLTVRYVERMMISNWKNPWHGDYDSDPDE